MGKIVQSVEWNNDRLILLDQTQLPAQTVYIELTEIVDVWEAIHTLKVRGAPAIGMAAAYGLYLGVRDSKEHEDDFLLSLEKKAAYLTTARPTAVNLCWAIERLLNRAYQETALGSQLPKIKAALLEEALFIQLEDEEACRNIGEHALTLFKDDMGILTHCNAGSLATAKYGTATAPFYLAKARGWHLKVFAGETRPVLQGARLTAWELQQADIDVTLLCDNMAAMVMAKGWIQAVIVGTDRVAANGDTANKIGTYGLALLAKAHNIPFYVAAPTSSIDLQTMSGLDIPIEERPIEEVAAVLGKRTAPEGIKIYNPAFDVTPYHLITAFITEKGIVHPDQHGQYNLPIHPLLQKK